MKTTTIINGKYCEIKSLTNEEIEGFRSGKGKIKLINRDSNKRYKFDWIYDERNDTYYVGIKHRGTFHDFEVTPYLWNNSGSYDVRYQGEGIHDIGFIASHKIVLNEDGSMNPATWAYVIDKFVRVIDRVEEVH